MPPSTDLLQGTLDLLILRTLALEPMHGWGIALRIQQLSRDVLQVGQGSLYPALHRLEYKGWIRADWGTSDNNRRARYYALTRGGKKQLDAELATWDRLSTAVALVLGRDPAEASWATQPFLSQPPKSACGPPGVTQPGSRSRATRMCVGRIFLARHRKPAIQLARRHARPAGQHHEPRHPPALPLRAPQVRRPR